MQSFPIEDLVPGLVDGIHVQMPGEANIEKEEYFEWAPSNLITHFDTLKISGGVLRSNKHVPIFDKVETHIDAEMFYFQTGIALMIFVDIEDGIPVLNSAQIVRIQPDTQIIIPPGKAHYVPVPEGDDPLEIIVVAPKMGDIIMELPEPIEGVI